MLGQLKNKFFSLHEEITSSVSKYTPLAHDPAPPISSFDAGDELLEYWQIQWETIHMAQDQNGRGALRCDRAISAALERIQKQWDQVSKLQSLIGQIPKMNEDIENTMKTLGNLESQFSDVEISLLALEDTIDAREQQEKQLEQRFQVAMYQERRKAEFNELSNRLQSEYQRKKAEFERKQLLQSQERQRIAKEKFESDMIQFKTSGQLLQTPLNHDPEAALESVDLNDDAYGAGASHLEAFLSEESRYDVSPLPRDDHLPRRLSSDSSTSTEKGSDNEQEKVSKVDATVQPKDQNVDGASLPTTLDVDAGSVSTKLNVDDVLSPTESMYYTPDATTDRLSDLSLQ